MNSEILNQAINLFDKYEKWDAFVELSNSRNDIANKYFSRLKSRINQLSINNETLEWNLLLYNNHEGYRWYLNDFGQNSICLNWDWNNFRLWCEPNSYDVGKAKNILTEDKYLPLKNCFDNRDTISNPNSNHFYEEKHRYYFSDGLSYSGIDSENREKLSWFAGNKTEEMANMIIEKVNRFRTPEITQLLRELNKVCKK
jgi:hypothetical protein